MAHYKIPVFKPDIPTIEEIQPYYRAIHDSGIVSNQGQFCQKFENIAKDYLNVDYAIGVNSCDSGLMMAIAAMEIPQGFEVILPSFTFTSTVNAPVWNGLKPHFVDIDPDTFLIDLKKVQEVIDTNTKLVICTNIFGNRYYRHAFNWLNIDKSCNILFDAAHSYGTLDDINTYHEYTSVFSFSGTKLVTAGEGGIITTDNELIANKLEYMRRYGFYGDYNAKYTGLNGKISEFNAAVGCVTLPKIDEAVVKRNEIAAKYKTLLGDRVKYQEIITEVTSAYKDFAVLFETQEQRDKVYAHLENNGIQSKKYFMPLHRTDRYKHLAKDKQLPNTAYVADRILCIPIYNSITDLEIEEVASGILECLK